MLFENKVFGRIFVSRKDEMMREWRKFHNSNSPPDAIRKLSLVL
jgi:hypothetical protein